MKKVLLTSAVVLTAFGAYNVANAETITVPTHTVDTATFQTLKAKIEAVKTGGYFYYENGSRKTGTPDAALAKDLTDKVKKLQQAITDTTKATREYNTIYSQLNDALANRKIFESKVDALNEAVSVAGFELGKLYADQHVSTAATTGLEEKIEAIRPSDGSAGTLEMAKTDLKAQQTTLEELQKALVDFKAKNASSLDSDDPANTVNYEQDLKAKQDAVDAQEKVVKTAKDKVAKIEADLKKLENELDEKISVDAGIQVALRQARRKLNAAVDERSENEGKLKAVKELINGTTAHPEKGLNQILDKLEGDATVNGSLRKLRSELVGARGAAEALFATTDANVKYKSLGFKLEFDKLKVAIEELLNQNLPAETPATPATPAKAAWVQSGSSWWYKHADGSYTTNGWEKINGTWYHFDQAGWMQTGWVKDNGTWYYLNNNGSMATGWYKVGEKWYYSYASGALAVNTTVNGYTVNENGEWVK